MRIRRIHNEPNCTYDLAGRVFVPLRISTYFYNYNNNNGKLRTRHTVYARAMLLRTVRYSGFDLKRVIH